jgi:hypothetical protein
MPLAATIASASILLSRWEENLLGEQSLLSNLM